jgi:hypothetical protein
MLHNLITGKMLPVSYTTQRVQRQKGDRAGLSPRRWPPTLELDEKFHAAQPGGSCAGIVLISGYKSSHDWHKNAPNQ